MTKSVHPLSAKDRLRLKALRDALAPIQTSVNLPMLMALLSLAVEPGLSVNELADRTGTSQQTASRHASILMGRYESEFLNAANGKPLIAQEIHPVDPRKRALFLTDAGWKLIASFLQNQRPNEEAS